MFKQLYDLGGFPVKYFAILILSNYMEISDPVSLLRCWIHLLTRNTKIEI